MALHNDLLQRLRLECRAMSRVMWALEVGSYRGTDQGTLDQPSKASIVGTIKASAGNA